jgi:hypothetical protein
MNTDTSKYSPGQPKRQGKSVNSQYFRETKQSAQAAHSSGGTVDRITGFLAGCQLQWQKSRTLCWKCCFLWALASVAGSPFQVTRGLCFFNGYGGPHLKLKKALVDYTDPLYSSAIDGR